MRKSTISEKTCLFGGTFDPIHKGHIHIAKSAQEKLQLDRIIFLPCRQSPHKLNYTPADDHHRLAMCKIATAGLPWAEVDNYDLTAPNPSYSWRTAEAFKSRYPHAELYWLMGTDQWLALPHWHQPERLAQLVKFIVFSRGEKAKPQELALPFTIDGDHPSSATEIRAQLQAGKMPHALQPEVLEYIIDHQLYGFYNQAR